jgi:hypothetical protein
MCFEHFRQNNPGTVEQIVFLQVLTGVGARTGFPENLPLDTGLDSAAIGLKAMHEKLIYKCTL